MKKFLLKGKQLISKKLQQFDIQSVRIDYVDEQTPNRLKQPLSVLKQNEIDLQDNHDYETYFKNYPNHHLSHYLLDKVKGNEKHRQKKSDKTSKSFVYAVPKNDNECIPQFDQNLQQKALQFKSAIEQYDEGFNKSEQPLVCICVIHFHHKRGTEIQFRYPDNKNIDSISDKIVHHAMPDSSHLRDQDCNFFNFQSDCLGKKKMLFGVSYFKQVKTTQQMKKNNNQLTRSHVQKAIAVISTLPLFQYLKIRLQNTTQVFFQNLTNFQLIEQAYTNICHNLEEAWPNIQLPDLYMGSQLQKIISSFGIMNLYDIWKAVLYQKRVVIFAQTSSDASSFILTLLSLFPGLSAFGICSKPISRYLQSLRQYALPLRLFNSTNFLGISFHVQDFWQLSKFIKNQQGNFLLGTTNRLLKQSNQYGIEMLVNLEECSVTKNKFRRPWEPLTKKQKTFISELKQLVQNQSLLNSPAIQDIVRSHFHQFLKVGLLQMIVGIRDYQNFIIECGKYEKQYKKNQKTQQYMKDTSYKPMQDQDENTENTENLPNYAPTFPESTSQIIFPQLLLNKSFAYFRQFHNSHLPEIVSGKIFPSIYINNYDYYFRISPEQFIAYNWLEKKLIFGKGSISHSDGKQIRFRSGPSLQILKQCESESKQKEQARSIYIGMLINKKYAKHGFYVDKSEHYQGQFANGMKHGYGKYSNQTDKYIGNFVNNLYDGEGQLIKNGQVYVGTFKQGLKHGLGSLQGENTFSGQWRFDKPIKEVENLQIPVKDGEKRKYSGSGSESQKRRSPREQTKKN